METSPTPGLPAHIKALLDPKAYPERPARIELRQTHISYLFFTPEFVYKIKKPVNFGFLDFFTLEKRLFFCLEEVRLNQRLAPDMYLGVVAVCEEKGGCTPGRDCTPGSHFHISGPGVAVDYAVKMKRLSPDTILEEIIKKDSGVAPQAGVAPPAAAPDVIRKVARVIAAFHMSAATDARISSFGSIKAVRKNCEENFSQTEGFSGGVISKQLFHRIRDYTFGFLKDNEALFLERIASGFIRDVHGDIHLENVSIDNGVAPLAGVRIFDCIEFNERFRFEDTAADLSFLSMDLDFHNRHDLARALEGEYFAAMNDANGPKLLNFYKCYRAYVRGKVDSLKFMETEVGALDRNEALLSALRHFRLAGDYASGGFAPTLIIVRGLSGAGKTTLARMLGEALNAPVISSDIVRKELAGVSARTRLFAGFKKGIYTDEFTEKTYSELISRGATLLKQGRACILDATFSKNRFIEKAREAASSAGGVFKVIEILAKDADIKKRLAKRLAAPPKPGEPVSDMTLEIYQEQKNAFEPADVPHFICNAGAPLDENLSASIKWLFG